MHKAYIIERPDAAKAVLMIHGICSTPRHFDFLLQAFDETWSVYNILLDGHGGNVRDFGNPSMKKWKAQTREMLEQLCSRYETVVLVGYSMGTLLEMDAMSAYPQVKGVFFMNVPMYPYVALRMMTRSLRMAFGKPRLHDPHEQACTKDVSIALTPKMWEYVPWIPSFIGLLRLAAQCCKTADIRVPGYAYFGGRDELVRVRSARHFVNNTHIKTRIFDTAGHFWYAPEDRQTVLQDLAELLNRVEKDKNIV